MSDDAPLPIADLIAPLEGDSAVGANLRADDSVDPALREVRDLAKQATYEERKAGDLGNDPTYAALSQWRSVSEQCQAILREQSKDFEVSALLVEAEVRTSGLAGMASGFELVAVLAEHYWSDILARAKSAVAEPDEESIVGDLLSRLNKWNDALPGPLARVPITAGGDAGDYALWQYQQASQADKENLSPEERERRKAITIEQFARSVALTAQSKPAMLLGVLADLDRAQAAATRLEEVFQGTLTGELSMHAPTLSKVRERLEDIERCLQHTGKDVIAALTAAPVGESGAAAGGGAAGATAAPAGQLADRDQAFRELSRIADFFARTEPLSLLAEQIRQVVHRGRLPPEQYYKELIDSEESQRQFFRVVGIKPASSDESS
jgi:type VI secretion system protein ImpA